MHEIDKRNVLAEDVFSYKVSKDKKVFIFWKHKQIMILKGEKSETFLAKIENADHLASQLIMAKVTGNFKHGNEKLNKAR